MPINNNSFPKGWVMTDAKGVGDSFVENGFPPMWQLRVSIIPTKTNLEKALSALNNLAAFNGPTYPFAKLFDNPDDLTTWDGTIADASDRDQRGKELCIEMPYDSGSGQFIFDEVYFKNLILDVWKAFENAGVEMNYITPNKDEKELSSDPFILTPFFYSSFKPSSGPEGIMLADSYNPMGHPEPLKTLHISESDLNRKGITQFNALTISQSRIRYMETHAEATIERLNDRIMQLEKLETAIPNSWTNRINEALASNDDTFIGSLLTDLLNNYVDFVRSYPSSFGKGGRIPLLNEGEIKYWSRSPSVEGKKEMLSKFLKNSEQAIQQLENDLIAQIWPIEKPNDAIIGVLANAFPYELQSIQRQFIHLDHELSALERERSRLDLLKNIKIESEKQPAAASTAIRNGSIVGLVGFAAGGALGIALVLTGVFAPLGVGILGAMALGAVFAVSLGAVSGLISGALTYRMSSEMVSDISTLASISAEPEVVSRSYQKMSVLTEQKLSTNDASYDRGVKEPVIVKGSLFLQEDIPPLTKSEGGHDPEDGTYKP